MGSIDNHFKGRYRARWRDPDGKQRTKVFNYKADARAHLDRVDAEIEQGAYLDPADRRMTVGQYVTDHWLPAQQWRPLSVERFRSQWVNHLEPRWGDVKLGAIRRTDIQRWVNGLSETLAPATVGNLNGRLAAILKSAHHDRLIDHTPGGVKLPKVEQAGGRVHVPTPAEVEALTQTVPPHYRALVLVCSTLGLRPGEAIGLTTDRVNELHREVVVDRQLLSTAQGFQFGPPKSSASHRTIPAPKPVIEALIGHADRFGGVEFDGSTLIFGSQRGAPVKRSTLSETWHRAARKADVNPELKGWHCLRHYAITTLIAGGVNPDYVRRFAGHATLSQTLDTYSGWWPSDADDARQVLEQALNEAAG